MDQMSTEMEQQHQPKRQHIEWRRERVAELSAQGRTEREIASILKVAPATVARDLAYLNKQARESLSFHIQERLPAQYMKCQSGLDQVLKMAWNIVLLESINQSNKLQALSLISDCYRYQMDLATNGVVVTDAIKYVNGKMKHLNNQEKKLLQDIKNNGDAKAKAEDTGEINSEMELEEQPTHNGIF
jgi:IS30 family transposase